MGTDTRTETDQIPVFHVKGRCLPEAWEKALLAVWDGGVEVATEYAAEDDPLSLDATVVVEVSDPLGEPRLHKNFPGGPRDLEVYRQEVIEGVHDHWIKPREGKWTYTYHQRLFAYRAISDAMEPEASPFGAVDQIDYMVEKLSEAPHTRRAQGITWIPHSDPKTDDPPCLQRVWARLLPCGEGEGYRLNLNTHWRSRDLVLAWFMNAFGFTYLQSFIAEKISDKLGVPVRCSRYVDISDSLHIKGSLRTDDLTEEVKKMKTSPWTDRAWETSKFQTIFEEARQKLEDDPDYFARGGKV